MTGTSSRATLALLALAATAAGCGHTSRTGAPPVPSSGASWLRPAPAPDNWPAVTLATGATMAYPRGWRPETGDRGTATATLRSPGGALLGYLNITPRQGAEAVRGWPTFRLAHNAGEGERQVRRLASYPALRFRTGRGACVRDGYVTRTGARYVELACLVTGHASTVIVGAAPPRWWPRMAPQIERAISAFTT